MDAQAAIPASNAPSPATAFALRRPGSLLAILLGLHVVVWTALPILFDANLQLDLAEDLALGKEWQLGYWKHPPLPWWLADLAFRLTGRIEAVHILAPLCVAACWYAVYRLSQDIVGPVQALIATLALQGIHFYNYSSVKFAHDQMQLPFWALTGLFLYRGFTRDRAWDWMLAGVSLALAFWSKYAAVALALSLVIFMLADRDARAFLKKPGPYLMAAAFAVVIAPNAWWLIDNGFPPLRYIDMRAKLAEHWFQLVTFPAQWFLSQIGFVFPTLLLLGITLFPRKSEASFSPPVSTFARRYVAMLAFGPFAVVMLLSLIAERLPLAMWGYPLWSFMPLAAVVWFGPVIAPARLRFFAVAFIVLALAPVVGYAAQNIAAPLIRDRPKATQFPGRAIAEGLTREWRETTNAPLVYVAGTEFVVNNVAVYSADRPHVIVHGRPKLSPWIDMADVRRRGVVVVWEESLPGSHIAEWKDRFSATGEPQLLIVPRLTTQAAVPVRIRYFIVPPRP